MNGFWKTLGAMVSASMGGKASIAMDGVWSWILPIGCFAPSVSIIKSIEDEAYKEGLKRGCEQ
jgi:hypothetical protein